MQKEAEELTSHFIGMAESPDSSNEQMMSTFAEFSDVSIFNISKDGSVILHSGMHDRADRSFIHASDVSRIFAGKTVNFEYKDPTGHRYFITGKPISDGHTIQSALYVMSSTENMKQSLASIRNLLLLAGVGALYWH